MNHLIQQKGEVVCVYLIGKVPNHYYVQIESDIDQILSQGQAKNILVNMQNLNILSSFGLKFLLLLSKKAKELGGKLKLAEVPRQALGTMTIASMDRLFEIFCTEQEALQSFEEK